MHVRSHLHKLLHIFIVYLCHFAPIQPCCGHIPLLNGSHELPSLCVPLLLHVDVWQLRMRHAYS
jgi:hypothetical protein